MKTLILLLSLTITTQILGDAHTHYLSSKPKVEMVYVCVSSKAYAYHSDRNCKGLSHCRHTITKESKKDAIKDGYRPCKICYK